MAALADELYRTRWKDPVTGRRPSPVYDTVDEVLDFRAHQRVARARGDVAQARARRHHTLEQFADVEYWPRWAPSSSPARRSRVRQQRLPQPPHPQDRTRRSCASSTPPRVEDLARRRSSTTASAPRPCAARSSMLSAICTRAVAAGSSTSTPSARSKPPVTRQTRAIYTPGAVQIEAIRASSTP
jgi:hypothetical protein